MNDVQDLIKKYPELFEPDEIRLDRMKSCMAWGIECNNGWYEILDSLMNSIMNLPHENFYFTQIKQKFGSLRIYISGGSKEVIALVNQAENKSYEKCEICGEPGETRKGPWVYTLCDQHEEERQKTLKE